MTEHIVVSGGQPDLTAVLMGALALVGFYFLIERVLQRIPRRRGSSKSLWYSRNKNPLP